MVRQAKQGDVADSVSEVETLAPRILLFGTCDEGEVDDDLLEDTGDIASLMGFDALDDESDDGALDGGPTRDTADYSAANSAVSVDLTSAGAQDTGGAGMDTLSRADAVVGTRFADTFAFTDPAPGATYIVDGSGGHNTIDVSEFGWDEATLDTDQGTLSLDLGHDDSSTIHFANITAIRFRDVLVDPGDPPPGTEIEPTRSEPSKDRGEVSAEKTTARAPAAAPAAPSNHDQVATPGDRVELDARALRLRTKDRIYNWTMLSGDDVVLLGADTATPHFTAPDVANGTELVFQVMATDGRDVVVQQRAVTISRPERHTVDEHRMVDGRKARSNEIETTEPMLTETATGDTEPARRPLVARMRTALCLLLCGGVPGSLLGRD